MVAIMFLQSVHFYLVSGLVLATKNWLDGVYLERAMKVIFLTHRVRMRGYYRSVSIRSECFGQN